MRIGIDAKWYFDGPPSGHIVVRNLVDQIIENSGDKNIIYLFLEKNDIPQATKMWKSNNVKFIFLPKMLNLISNIFLIHFYATKYGIDTVLFQNFSSFLPSKWKKVVYIHDFLFLDYPEFYSKQELIYFKPMLWLARKSDYVITISESEKNRMLRHKVALQSDIFVVHHGINERFAPKTEFSKESLNKVIDKYNLPKQYLLYVGRINIRKNVLNLIKGFHLSDNQKSSLVIVGKIDHKNVDVNHYIRENGLSDRIQFLGHVSDEDLYKIYALAHIFCFPSYAEGFGLPPLEAMKAGIPSIVSDTTSLPEVCGNAAVYINPDDPQNIAEKIDKLTVDKEYYNLMKERSLVHSKNFSWKSAALSIINILTH